MRKRLLIMVTIIFFMANLNTSYASGGSLAKIEILPGMKAYIDLTQKAGEVEIYEKDGNVTLANYKITQTDNGEYITFTRLLKNDHISDMLELNYKEYQRYWKDNVKRTYPRDFDFPGDIQYAEVGLYGYASGTLYWYAIGGEIGGIYRDVWYQGWLYYGDAAPFSIGEIDY